VQDTVSYTDWYTIQEDGTVETPSHVERLIPTEDGYILDVLLGSRSIANSTILVPGEAFNVVGLFNEQYKIAEDLDMLFRLAAKYKFKFTGLPLYGYRILTNSISSDRRIYLNRKMNPKAEIVQKYIKVCFQTGGFRNDLLRRDAHGKLMRYVASTHDYKKLLKLLLTNYDCFRSFCFFLTHKEWTTWDHIFTPRSAESPHPSQ